VVDWYGGRKQAYFALRNVQRNQLVMLGDDHVAWAVNDSRHPVKGHAKFTDRESGKVLFDADYEVAWRRRRRTPCARRRSSKWPRGATMCR